MKVSVFGGAGEPATCRAPERRFCLHSSGLCSRGELRERRGPMWSLCPRTERGYPRAEDQDGREEGASSRGLIFLRSQWISST